MLVRQLLEIQRRTVSREKLEEWAERLRFLDISRVIVKSGCQSRRNYRKALNKADIDLKNRDIQIIPLTDRVSRKYPYIAISWRWKRQPSQDQREVEPKYWIQGRQQQFRPTKVPDIYLDRAIHFAKTRRIYLIWIDKECIDQENKKDKDKGIQVMDLVYRQSEISLGLLEVELQSQKQLDSLSLILRYTNRPFEDFNSKIHKYKEIIPEIREVLDLILRDERWDRTWIFQEDHCASGKMHLLIRHAPALHKAPSILGDLPGEVDIPCAWFRTACTMFGKACTIAKLAQPVNVAKVQQYNISSNEHGSRMNAKTKSRQSHSPLTASSLSILDDIKARQNRDVSDRLAIFANCCQYRTRLDTPKLEQLKYGLSTCLLCLYLINGEVLRTSIGSQPNQSPQGAPDILNYPVYQVLRTLSLRFNPPVNTYQLSFIDKHCRFGRVKLTQFGIETRGRLWTIDETIAFTERDREKIKTCYIDLGVNYPGFDNCTLYVLFRKLQDLRHYSLLAEFRKYLEVRQSKSFIDMMLKAVLKALRLGKTLRLARLIGETDPSGVFLDDTRTSTRKMAFTSYSEEMDRVVSIEVQYKGGRSKGQEVLYTQSWMNGVYFAYGKSQKTYLFAWPFAPEDSRKKDLIDAKIMI
ncbi:MAG: hypothetical protein LQ351_007099 [Letrouitia transgressa]|nr:MAG: hypothetical protein LQ351_007099 [Letrouitia transgressa]